MPPAKSGFEDLDRIADHDQADQNAEVRPEEEPCRCGESCRIDEAVNRGEYHEGHQDNNGHPEAPVRKETPAANHVHGQTHEEIQQEKYGYKAGFDQ